MYSTRFEECFLFDFNVVWNEIIIKSSFEIQIIIKKNDFAAVVVTDDDGMKDEK